MNTRQRNKLKKTRLKKCLPIMAKIVAKYVNTLKHQSLFCQGGPVMTGGVILTPNYGPQTEEQRIELENAVKECIQEVE